MCDLTINYLKFCLNSTDHYTPVRLALVLNKISSDAKEYYEGVTVLLVEWAYMNSRLIVKPDEEWAKIVDEVDSISEGDSIQNVVDNVN